MHIFNLLAGLIFAVCVLVAFSIYMIVVAKKKPHSEKRKENICALVVFCIGLIASLISISVTKAVRAENIIYIYVKESENVARVSFNGNAYTSDGYTTNEWTVLDDITVE